MKKLTTKGIVGVVLIVLQVISYLGMIMSGAISNAFVGIPEIIGGNAFVLIGVALLVYDIRRIKN